MYPESYNRAGSQEVLPVSMMAWKDVLKEQRAKAKRNKPPNAPVLTRKAFCASQKKAVCEIFSANPTMKHHEIAKLFGVDRSMVMRVIREQEMWKRSKHTPGQDFARKRYSELVSDSPARND